MSDGWALRRNNSCHAADRELNCGKTWSKFHMCCPWGTNCADDHQCRKTNKPVTGKHCANETWSLYEAKGYFCCDRDQKAFMLQRYGYVGCAKQDYHFRDGEVQLQPVTRGHTATSTSATASATSQSASPTSTASSDSSSGTNKGAIAGGVVGGVAGVAIICVLIWFLMRRRARSKRNDGYAVPPAEAGATSLGPQVVEADNDGLVHEVEGQSEVKKDQPPVHELPAQ